MNKYIKEVSTNELIVIKSELLSIPCINLSENGNRYLDSLIVEIVYEIEGRK